MKLTNLKTSKRVRWSPADRLDLRNLAERGLSAKEIATVMNRTDRAINAKASRWKITINGRAGEPARALLDAGGVVMRETVETAAGEALIRWTSAHRSSGTFPTPIMEYWLSIGDLVPYGDSPTLFRKRGA